MTSQLDQPSQWTTGAEAPTEKQKAFLAQLAGSKNADIDPSSLNKSEASQKIDELKKMADQAPGEQAPTAGEPIQDPDSWATGDEPATGKQTGYIAAMSKQAGEPGPREGMGKTEASKRIEELKAKTGM